jgi:Sulfotransferase family
VRLHFIHVGKTGGTAIKEALREAGLAVEGPESRYVQTATHVPATPYGQIVLHNHGFGLRDLPPDDFAFFFLRDPISRFVSGFSSRLRKGQPRYLIEWTAKERAVFERYPTPETLFYGLVSEDAESRELAEWAMKHLQHVTRYSRQVGPPKQLRATLPRIVYIGRQETLDRDWHKLKSVLELPGDLALSTDPVVSHRGDPSVDRSLDTGAREILRDWYAPDYRVLRICERVRARNGWGATARGRVVAGVRRSAGGRFAARLVWRLRRGVSAT